VQRNQLYSFYTHQIINPYFSNMHRLKFLLLQFILLLGLSVSIHAHVALDYPQGGETFVEGTTIVIRWHIVAEHETLNWDLLFSSNGGADWEPILLNIQLDSLTYTWVIPSVFSSQCRVRVIQDNTGQDYYGTSEDFTIIPNTSAPSIDAPAEYLTFECDIAGQEMILQAWLDNHGGASATNYCGELIWTHDYNGLSDGCGATGSALVVFTATDDCGSTYTVATVAVTDFTPPSIDVGPSDLILECGEGNSEALNQWLALHGGAQASDACGIVGWTYDFFLPNDACGETGSMGVTFSATDECANSTPLSVLYQIIDTTPPEISQPARDTIFECSNNIASEIQSWLDDHGSAIAGDNCWNFNWTHDYTGLVASCGNAGSANVMFTATDECGNSATTSASLAVIDTSAPVLTHEAQDTVIICGASEMLIVLQSWLDRHGGAMATDACGNVHWSYDDIAFPDSCFTHTVVITFTASDDCGNSATSQASLMFLDTITIHEETTVFAPIGSTWYYSGESFGPPWQTDPLFGYYFVEKDTFLLGRQARAIGWYSNDEGIIERVDSLSKYVSVEGDRVYYKVGNEFVLLYDFGAAPGDTIYSKVESSDLSLGCISDFEEEVIDFGYVIDSVGTMTVDGEELRVQYVTSLSGSGEDQWGFFSDPVIERIGYYGWGGFWWGQGLTCILETGYLRCYEDPDISWRHPDFNQHLSCEYISSVAPVDIGYIALYPNPTSGLVMLPEGVEEVEVYSMEGMKMAIEVRGNEIDLSGFSFGMYIVRFEKEGKLYLGKAFLK
jgi:hypothetical protein